MIASFISITLLLFLAALPGRTTFLILLLASKFRPVPVVLGSILAFSVQAAISVALGNVIGLFPIRWVHLFSGLVFFGMGTRMWVNRDQPETPRQMEPAQNSFRSTHMLYNAFIAVFIAEWGDVSQIAIATVAAHHEQAFLVWIAASIALALTAITATLVGGQLHKILSPRKIHLMSILAFLSIGTYFLVISF